METSPRELDIHPATQPQRLAAYRNVFDVWSGGHSLEEHLARRLASPQHNRAAWFVGCIAGQVVASLACYPLRFHVRGGTVAGMAIGSVHTLAEFRGRGFAPRLISWVERRQRAQGVAISLLYSDIAPAYYARLGYQQCPAWEGYRNTHDSPPPAADDEFALQRFDPVPQPMGVAALYESHHGAAPLAVDRTADYWRYLLQKDPDDEFYLLADDIGLPVGYVRLAVSPSAARIADYAVARRDPDLLDSLYAAVLRLAVERRWPSVGGWLPDAVAAREWFNLSPRGKEITMLKSLDPQVRLDAATLASADAFCEVDHV